MEKTLVIVVVILTVAMFCVACGGEDTTNRENEGFLSPSIVQTETGGAIINILPCAQYLSIEKCREFEPAEEVLISFFKTIQYGWSPKLDRYVSFSIPGVEHPSKNCVDINMILDKISKGKGLKRVDLEPDRQCYPDSETGLLKAMFFYHFYFENGGYYRGEATIIRTNESVWKIKTLLD